MGILKGHQWEQNAFMEKKAKGGVIGLLWVYGWFTVGIQWVYSWCMVGLLWVYSWFTVGVWVVYCGCTVGLRLVYGWCMGGLLWVCSWFTVGLRWVGGMVCRTVVQRFIAQKSGHLINKHKAKPILYLSKFSWLLIPFALFLFSACETEFIPDDIPLEAEIVVEGYIEAGNDANPPFLLLTKSVPFFSEFDPNQIDNLFVHDALVEVSDGQETFILEEICLEEIPAELREIVLGVLGFDLDPDAELPNICAYVDNSGQLAGEFGGTYDLKITAGDQLITASTTIPELVPIYGFNFIKPTDFSPDSLLELRASIDDPMDEANFYRYFTAVNDEGFQAPFQSVTDDAFFDGQSFDFPLAKAESFIDPPGIDSFGLYSIGDTARIKWATLDEANYRFWSTLEFNAVSQGPFSSYTIVDSNVEGGIGIWGGYAVEEYSILVE